MIVRQMINYFGEIVRVESDTNGDGALDFNHIVLIFRNSLQTRP